jgi:hypothetical protein
MFLNAWIAAGGDLAAWPTEGLLAQAAGQSLMVEYGLVAVLIGGALFAVCRSSRRN